MYMYIIRLAPLKDDVQGRPGRVAGRV